MPFFAQAQNSTIQGERVRLVDSRIYNEIHINAHTNRGPTNPPHDTQVLATLMHYAIVDALPDVREQVELKPCGGTPRLPAPMLEEIACWIQGELHAPKRPVKWICKPSGMGGQAIVRRLLSEWAMSDCFAGAFLFSRDVLSQNHQALLVPTIAYQLVRSFPGLGFYMQRAIDQDPLIFRKPFGPQFKQLIVQTLRGLIDALRSSGSKFPKTKGFIIDDSDGCLEYMELRKKVAFITTILQENRLPLAFLIISHPPSPVPRVWLAPDFLRVCAFVLVRMNTWATTTMSGILCTLTCFAFLLRRYPGSEVWWDASFFWSTLWKGVILYRRLVAYSPDRTTTHRVAALLVTALVLHHVHHRIQWFTEHEECFWGC